MATSDIFDGDITSRYGEQKQPGNYSWRQAEQDYARDIFENPQDTMAGYAWNFQQTHVDQVAALLASGDYAAAKEGYDSLRESIKLNWEGLASLSQVDSADYGDITRQLGARAKSMIMGEYNQQKVVLSDGTETTIGQALADNSPFLSNQSDTMTRYGFGESATQAYLNGDAGIKAIMDPMLRSARAGKPVPNRMQLIELADDYANNIEKVQGVFGDGTKRFMDYLMDTHLNSGGGAYAFRTLVDLAEDYSRKTGMTGKRLANEIVTGYNDLLSTCFQSNVVKDSRGVSRPAPISDDQRRLFDATIIPAVTQVLQGLDEKTPFNLKDPRVKQAMLEVADTMAYARAAGVDIFANARNAGYDINNALGGYVRNAYFGMAQPSDNLVEGFGRMRDDLLQRITGGRSPQTIATSLSGNPADYLKTVESRTKVRSLCPEADGMADTIHSFLLRELTPDMARGKYYADAAMEKKADLVAGLTKKLARSFFGPGRTQAAQALASAALLGAVAADGSVITKGFLNGGNVNIEDLVVSLAFAPGADGNSPTVRSLRTWYSGNVAREMQFGDRKTRLRSSLAADGVPDIQARQIASSTASLAAENLEKGVDPNYVFDNAESQGMYLTITKDANGQPYIGYQTGNRNNAQVQFDYNGSVLPAGTFLNNRTVWEQAQNALKQLLKRQQALMEYQTKQQIKAAAEQDDGLD